MFVDTAKVSLKAGKGGDGAVSFRHEIYIPKGGPDGGDGGRGGSIIFRADKDTNTLLDFRYNPILTAEDGKNGAGQRAAGRSGKDLIVEVPIGTVVYKTELNGADTSSRGHKLGRAPLSVPREDGIRAVQARQGSPRTVVADLVTDGQEAIITRGGTGGFGNAHFKSSTRQTPKIAEVGEPGEEFEAELELKLLADVGLVGLPNAGKSTFLSVVSNAKPEIADYPFTTITPNLGVATIDGRDLLIADIPGLIEGASEGKGLGHAFLRHVDRTAVLLHLIDVYNDDAGAAYHTIRAELEKYSDLKDRPEIVALTKTEGLDDEIIKMQMASILKQNPDAKVYAISSAAHQGLDALLRALKDEVDKRQIVDDKADAMTSSRGHKLGRPAPWDAASAKRDTPLSVPSEDGHASALSESRDDGPEREWVKKPASPDLPNVDSHAPVLPVISLSPKALKDSWAVTEDDGKFIVTGEKIEKFARRTDLSNYASLNRLRDIMKKMGIRAELTGKGAKDDSIISIAGKEFTLVEDW